MMYSYSIKLWVKKLNNLRNYVYSIKVKKKMTTACLKKIDLVLILIIESSKHNS